MTALPTLLYVISTQYFLKDVLQRSTMFNLSCLRVAHDVTVYNKDWCQLSCVVLGFFSGCFCVCLCT